MHRTGKRYFLSSDSEGGDDDDEVVINKYVDPEFSIQFNCIVNGWNECGTLNTLSFIPRAI